MTFLSDTFTEASNAALTAHAPEVGGAWVAHANFPTAMSVIAAEDRLAGTSGTSIHYNNVTPPSADYEITAVVRASAGDSSGRPGILARCDPSASTFYQLYFTGSDWSLAKQVAGVNTPIWNTTTPSLALNVDHTLSLKVQGSSITATINGVQANFTDSSITSAGYVAVRSAENGRIDNLVAAAIDTTAPTLTSPTGTQTGSTTASGTVSTNEANGTLYRMVSTNATETAATVKAAALTQAVTATGSQAVSFSGLTPSTTYYAHYVHRDAAGNDSARVSSASFTTPAGADTTPPVLTGSITIGTVTPTSIQISWPAGTDNVAVTSYEVSSNGGANWIDTGNTSLTYTFTGLTPSTTYALRVRAKDAGNNVSTSPLAASQATSAPVTVTLTTDIFENWATNDLANQVIENVVLLRRSDRTVIAQLTNQTTNPDGRLVITNNGLAAGVPVMVVSWNADGSVAGIKSFTPV